MILRTVLIWIMLLGSLAADQYVVVVVDDSGSMQDRMRGNRSVRKIDAAKEALAIVLDKLPDDAEIGVLALNNDWIRPLAPIDRSQLKQQIGRLRASGGTPLGNYMKTATDALLNKRADKRYGDFRLLVVTDGEANDQDVLDAVLPDIMRRGLTVDVIGVDMESEHSLATQVHKYRRADDPSSLRDAIAEALAESDDEAVAGGESDFELLEGFPADLAPAVLTALTSFNNAPINSDPRAASVSEETSVVVPVAAPSGGGGVVRVGIVGALVCVGFVLLLVTVLSSLMRAARRV